MAAANLVGGAESGPVWSPAIFSREQTRAFIAIISKRNIAELLGEGGPRPSLAKYDLRVRRGPKGFGASTNDTESSEHCRALHGSAERAAPTSVPFLAAQEPFGLGVRLVRSRSARSGAAKRGGFLKACAHTSPLVQSDPAARPGALNAWVLMFLPSRNFFHSTENSGHDI